jgi:anti-sigma regulatory factor (Ser/Thr protein kinase)
MTGVRARGEEIRRFILDHVHAHPDAIAKVAADRFGISRQAVNKHLLRLVREGCLSESGQTSGRSYKLAPLAKWTRSYEIVPGLAEDVIWTRDIRAALGQLPDNVMHIWNHGFTEMFNNAIDHSGGTTVSVEIVKTAASTEMLIHDNGVGIFRKIQSALGLLDERHAILELAKGKLTTDPERHSGEGIFFTSRMFDEFEILSGGTYFSHEYGDAEDWVFESPRDAKGTGVFMQSNNHTSRTTKKIFDEYVSGDDFGFTKTVVPVKLAQYGNDRLISRSQAKRLLARVELFKKVLFDFRDVDTVGQAFADEIFRVFANAHPEITLVSVHANEEVTRMITRVRGAPIQSASD